MAAPLAHFLETEFLECFNGLATGNNRLPWCHALSSRVAMIGGSISVGRDWSS